MKNTQSALPSYLLQTHQDVKQTIIKDRGAAYLVDKHSFPALDGVTCYSLEIWEECMRLPHWHPNCSELGYVISGCVEIMLWRSPGETSVFTVSQGMCWFIPQGALHSLNNIGNEPAKLLVGFSEDISLDMDLPVAFNGIPVPIRDAYTTPHSQLREWQGVTHNPLLGKFDPHATLHPAVTGSPYGFDLLAVTPLLQSPTLGSVVWGVKSNWRILEDISILRAHLKPGSARDAIWYPDAGTLYIVTEGEGEFYIVIANETPTPLRAKIGDYIFVPTGILHTFINTGHRDFEVVAFFTKADPLPEVSLTVATGFFPEKIRQMAMTEYGTAHQSLDPLKDLKYTSSTPYLLKVGG